MFTCLLSLYHYLGHRNTVGETIRYLVHDRAGRPVGCALIGSAAKVRGARRMDRVGSRHTGGGQLGVAWADAGAHPQRPEPSP